MCKESWRQFGAMFIAKKDPAAAARFLAGGRGGGKSLFAPGELQASAPRGSYVDPNTGQSVSPSGVSTQPSTAPIAFPSLGAASGGGSMSGTAAPSLFALRSK